MGTTERIEGEFYYATITDTLGDGLVEIFRKSDNLVILQDYLCDQQWVGSQADFDIARPSVMDDLNELDKQARHFIAQGRADALREVSESVGNVPDLLRSIASDLGKEFESPQSCAIQVRIYADQLTDALFAAPSEAKEK